MPLDQQGAHELTNHTGYGRIAHISTIKISFGKWGYRMVVQMRHQMRVMLVKKLRWSIDPLRTGNTIGAICALYR